jgi:DNA-binding HxlR family transcriptional regulator
MKNDEKKRFKDIKELLSSGAGEAVSVAFDWGKTPTEELWYQLDKKWKNQVLRRMADCENRSFSLLCN